MSRRQLLRYMAVAAATPIVLDRPWRPARAYAGVAAQAVPRNLELVTVTDTTAILTWLTAHPTETDEFGRPEPIPADTRVEMGTSPLSLEVVVDDPTPTAFHYVELTGLEPGRTYLYRASSNGIPAIPTDATLSPDNIDTSNAGVFTTLIPPSGDLLFTMCWANDLHIGEGTSGLAFGDFPPGFAADPDNPYWRFMATSAVAESKARGASLMLVAGDLTAEARPAELTQARTIFDGFGTYGQDYFITRGNHDRAHAGPEWDGCGHPVGGSHHDCLLDHFPLPDDRSTYSFDHQGVHIVSLDTNDLTTGNGDVSDEDFEWLEADLAGNGGRPTFLFGHHPIAVDSYATSLPPLPGVFLLPPDDAIRLQQVAGEHSVVGVYSGHTHRNKRSVLSASPGVPYVELGAVKEYPGGYGLVRVYEGGYMVNFHKTASPEARVWSERSRGEYFGLYPWYTLGALDDRNFVVEADFSDAARHPPAAPKPPGTDGAPGGPAAPVAPTTGGRLPATGGAGHVVGGLAAGAAAAAAAALAAKARHPD